MNNSITFFNIIMIIIILLLIFYLNYDFNNIKIENFSNNSGTFLELIQYNGEKIRYKLAEDDSNNVNNNVNKDEKVNKKEYIEYIINTNNSNTKFNIKKNKENKLNIIAKNNKSILNVNNNFDIIHTKYNNYSSPDAMFSMLFDSNIMKIEINDDIYYITSNNKIKYFDKIIGNITKINNNKYLIKVKFDNNNDNNDNKIENDKIVEQILYGYVIHLLNEK